jgi:putative endonuclease
MPKARKTQPKKPKVPPRTWCIYVMRCADDTLYCGITNDLERRLKQHNAGTGARYTRVRLPVILEGSWGVKNRSEALKGEFAFKKLNRMRKEQFLAEL